MQVATTGAIGEHYCGRYNHKPSLINLLPHFSHTHTHTRVIKVANDFVGKVTFAVGNKKDFPHELDQLGLDMKEEVVVGLFDSSGKKYAMQEKFR